MSKREALRMLVLGLRESHFPHNGVGAAARRRRFVIGMTAVTGAVLIGTGFAHGDFGWAGGLLVYYVYLMTRMVRVHRRAFEAEAERRRLRAERVDRYRRELTGQRG
jgi:hypothetical protein